MPVSSETKGIFGTFNGIGRRASRYMLLPSHSGEMKPRSRPNTLIVVVLVGVVLLLVEVVLRLTPTNLQAVTLSALSQLPFPLEDPYRVPGHVQFNPQKPFDTRWIPYDTPEKKWGNVPDWGRIFRLAANLPYPPDTIWNGATPGFKINRETAKYPLDAFEPDRRDIIRQKNLERIEHLRNTTILLLGDSVDRNSIDQYAWLYQTPFVKESFDGTPFNDGDPRTWGYPHIFRVGGEVNLTITNGFFYGSMDDVDDFQFAPDWIAPGKAEERVTELFKPFADRLETPPSLIQIHSGMWDLAFLGRQDKNSGTDTETPLSEERIAKWMSRVTLTIRRVRETWPGVPVVFRKIHRVGSSRGAEDWQAGQANVVNYFTDIRFQQIRHLQELVAQKEGIAVWDFGEIFEGFQRYQDKVHPTMYPGSTLMWNGLIHHAYLARHQKDYNRPPMQDSEAGNAESDQTASDPSGEGMGQTVLGYSKVAQLVAKMLMGSSDTP